MSNPAKEGERAVMMDAVRREAFVQGFVAARFPETKYTAVRAKDVLELLPEAEAAYVVWLRTRGGGS